MSQAYTLGLNFTAPSAGDTDWADVEDAKHTRQSLHDHTGAGLGTQIATGALVDNAVSAAKIRLASQSALRARNAAGSGDLDLLRSGPQDLLDFSTAVTYGLYSTETLTSSGAISLVTARTVLNGASLAMTLGAGTTGQIKVIYNAASTVATVTYATTRILSLASSGLAVGFYHGGAWQFTFSPACTQTETFAAVGTWSGTSSHVSCTGTTYVITTPTGAAGQQVFVQNGASGNVTFGGQVMATGILYLYSYLNAGWRRVALI